MAAQCEQKHSADKPVVLHDNNTNDWDKLLVKWNIDLLPSVGFYYTMTVGVFSRLNFLINRLESSYLLEDNYNFYILFAIEIKIKHLSIIKFSSLP